MFSRQRVLKGWGPSCWTRRQNNSTSTSTSFSSSRKPSTRSSTSFSSPRKPSTRMSTRSLIRGSRLPPLSCSAYIFPSPGNAQNTEHRTLVLWRRWLQVLGLSYKQNMPNNNTAYPICKINLSFISFLWVEQWSGGADVESRNTHMHLLSAQLKWTAAVLLSLDSPDLGYRGVVRILWILILIGIDSDERKT